MLKKIQWYTKIVHDTLILQMLYIYDNKIYKEGYSICVRQLFMHIHIGLS
jgi:hypothetical protein